MNARLIYGYSLFASILAGSSNLYANVNKSGNRQKQ